VFGSNAVTVPSAIGNGTAGFHLDASTLLFRLVIATGYVAFGFTALLALGTFFSTLTDTAAGAIGATIGVYIVSEILDGITQIGRIRYAFPTHYLSSWEPVFTQNHFPTDMLVGIAVQIAYLGLFGTAAIVWFRRKDLRS
jgi:ABC-2 type transport system permease protein